MPVSAGISPKWLLFTHKERRGFLGWGRDDHLNWTVYPLLLLGPGHLRAPLVLVLTGGADSTTVLHTGVPWSARVQDPFGSEVPYLLGRHDTIGPGISGTPEAEPRLSHCSADNLGCRCWGSWIALIIALVHSALSEHFFRCCNSKLLEKSLSPS